MSDILKTIIFVCGVIFIWELIKNKNVFGQVPQLSGKTIENEEIWSWRDYRGNLRTIKIVRKMRVK